MRGVVGGEGLTEEGGTGLVFFEGVAVGGAGVLAVGTAKVGAITTDVVVDELVLMEELGRIGAHEGEDLVVLAVGNDEGVDVKPLAIGVVGGELVEALDVAYAGVGHFGNCRRSRVLVE